MSPGRVTVEVHVPSMPWSAEQDGKIGKVDPVLIGRQDVSCSFIFIYIYIYMFNLSSFILSEGVSINSLCIDALIY